MPLINTTCRAQLHRTVVDSSNVTASNCSSKSFIFITKKYNIENENCKSLLLIEMLSSKYLPSLLLEVVLLSVKKLSWNLHFALLLSELKLKLNKKFCILSAVYRDLFIAGDGWRESCTAIATSNRTSNSHPQPEFWSRCRWIFSMAVSFFEIFCNFRNFFM